MKVPDTGPGNLGGARIAIANWRDPWHPQAGGAERYAWEMARGLVARGARVTFLTARAAGQSHHDRRDGIDIRRMGGRFTVYPLVLAWLLARGWTLDAVLDCQNGIPFFAPCALPRRVPVLCVVHHVHTDQFGVHFPGWAARLGRFLEGPVARRVYRRHACVAVSPSTVTAMRERLGWTGDIYLVPNGVRGPAALALGAAGVPQPQPPVVDSGSGPRRPRHAATPSVRGPASPPRHVKGAPAVPAPAFARRPAQGAPAVPAPAFAPDPAQGAPGAFASPSGPGSGAPAFRGSVVWVGRLVAHKRAELILPIADRLRADGIAVDVVGRGPAAPDLAARVAAAGLDGAVRLRGFLPEADKQALVSGALLHLNTSRGEGWGLCVLEAAALGVPTVAFDVDGLRDAVRDGLTGWLVRDGERIEDVTQRAVKELSDPVRRATVAAACRAWAALLPWDRSAARMTGLIAAAIRNGTFRGRTVGNGAFRGRAARSGAFRGGTVPDGTFASGTFRDGHRDAWIVSCPGPRGGRSVLAEGPVLDRLLEEHPAAVPIRPATDLERLLGCPVPGGGGTP